jgi:hypothetical protein
LVNSASVEYRVIDRKRFAVFMAVLLIIVSPGVWIGLDHLAAYAQNLEELAAAEPAEAAEIFARLQWTLVISNGAVLVLLAAVIIRHGWRGWRTASMPPIGSWILEGQRTWTGDAAVRIAQFTMIVGALLAIMAVASSWILWGLVDTLIAQAQEASRTL